MFNIFGTQSQRVLRGIRPVIDKINALEGGISALSEGELRAKTGEFKARVLKGLSEREEIIKELEDRFREVTSFEEKEKIRVRLKDVRNEVLDEILPEAFAVVREAAKRTVKMRHFDVQLMGGVVLHRGMISEMATGEGKTLVATLSIYLNTLCGQGVHLVTVNDYLAKRDREWMGPIYESLGLTVGVIQHDMDDESRRQAYACDITYGTNNEFGFDYLRDNMKFRPQDMVQRGFFYAIVDEVDSILIDEARTPLIISGPVEETRHSYDELRPFINRLFQRQESIIKSRLDRVKTAVKDGRTNAEEFNEDVYVVYKGSPKEPELMQLIAEHPFMRRRIDDAVAGFERKGFETEKMRLQSELYYVYDEKSRDVTLAQKGQDEFQRQFPGELEVEDIDDLIKTIRADASLAGADRLARERSAMERYEVRIRRLENMRQLLKAYVLFHQDVDYVISDNKVVIVDEFTGRMMPGRRFSDGLHEALEAKEGLEIQQESQTLATITFQNYFRMYSKLAGMTGTAMTEGAEFGKIYGLEVIAIPTNKPLIRATHPDVMFKTEREKFRAVCGEIAEFNKEGRPVLVGTISVEKSERLSALLTKRGIPHHVLNAKYHAQEAEIIARAGQPYAVTISTNMAGRGTDIVLGAGIADKGGLHVIGTERHESRRIDNQLRGRAGRQGDPGSSRFYLSLEDDLMRIFGSDRIAKIMEFFKWEEDMPIEHKLITRSIETAQKRVEEQNFGIRKHLLEYDNVMNTQRTGVYNYRREILEDRELKERIFEMAEETITAALDEYMRQDVPPAEWDLKGMNDYFRRKFLINTEGIDFTRGSKDGISEKLLERAKESYGLKESLVGAEELAQIVKFEMLRTVDVEWMHHLHTMDYLREGIGLRAYGQRDPLIEYKHEAHSEFFEMEGRVRRMTVERVFRIQLVKREMGSVTDLSGQRLIHDERSALREGERLIRQPAAEAGGRSAQTAGGRGNARGGAAGYQRPEAKGSTVETFRRDTPKVGRNEPCPCGSGKKYKMCCGK